MQVEQSTAEEMDFWDDQLEDTTKPRPPTIGPRQYIISTA